MKRVHPHEHNMATAHRRLGFNVADLMDVNKCFTLCFFCCFQAENLIREQLSKCETPDLLCHLGDVTGQPEHYHRAWQLSEGHSARSQRALAFFHFNRREVSICTRFAIVYFIQTNCFRFITSLHSPTYSGSFYIIYPIFVAKWTHFC